MQQILKAVSEEEWLNTIIAAARVYGWRVAHFRPALTGRGWKTAVAGDGAGFFDLVLVHPEQRRILFVEAKKEGRNLEPEQVIWNATVIAAGGTALVWRPHDNDLMHKTLSGEDSHDE